MFSVFLVCVDQTINAVLNVQLGDLLRWQRLFEKVSFSLHHVLFVLKMHDNIDFLK